MCKRFSFRGGILVLSEVTKDLAWYDITTGLIEGGSGLKILGGRTVHCCRPTGGTRLCGPRGFEEVEILPEPGFASEVLGQHVIIARAPYHGESPVLILRGILSP